MEENIYINLNQNENINRNLDQERIPLNRDNNIPFSLISNLQNFFSAEKFLFFFHIEKLANDCCCGCSIKTGIRIISFIFLINSAIVFFGIFSSNSLLNFISKIFTFSIYFSIGYNLLYSILYNSSKHAFYGYLIYSLLFFLSCLDSLFLLLISLFTYSDTFQLDKEKVKYIILIIAIVIFLSYHLYILYICFSFWKHMKSGNMHLINGEYINNSNNINNRGNNMDLNVNLNQNPQNFEPESQSFSQPQPQNKNKNQNNNINNNQNQNINHYLSIN
jgi:hypothetical protein